jgi:hypothetical protein
MSEEQFKLPSTTSRVTRTATCLCHKVHVQITGDDKDVVLCHCSNCKQRSGSAFMHNHRFMNASLQVLTGKDLLKQYGDGETKTGAMLFNHFCSNCVSATCEPIKFLI